MIPQQTIDETIRKVRTEGITETELFNAKEQLKGSFVLGLESTNSRMSRNGRNELIHRHHKTIDETITEIDKVSMEKVNRLIETIFHVDPAISIIGQVLLLKQSR